MILKPRYVARFRHVAAVLIRHGFADVLAALDLGRFLPGREHERASLEERTQQRARSLRSALEELGATYIKLGQVLSTRPDVLPDAYIDELAKLQDQVGPFDPALSRSTVELELGRPLGEVFARFENKPVASASLAQVHRATLAPDAPGYAPDREVAVKVLRPAIEEGVEVDLEILAEAARFVARSALGKRYDLVGIVDQLTRTLTGELDLRQEARNARRAALAVRELDRLRVPEVIEELTTRRILVTDYVIGTRLADLESGRREPVLADQLWRAYLRQILIDGSFGCDPHPGNFLIDQDGRVALLDHGQVAHLSRETQIQLMMLLLALCERDGDQVAEACFEIGVPGSSFQERRFKSEIGQMVARHSGLALSELALGQVILELVRLCFRNDIQIPPEMMLLGKTLLNLEGVCHRLDPDLDPVATMREVAASLLARQLARDATRHKALAATLELRSMAREIPASVRRILRLAASNDFQVGLRLEGEAELHGAIQKIASRITLGLITAALIVGSALLLNVEAGWKLWGYPVFALVGFLLAAGLGLYVMTKIILVDRY